MELAVRKQEFVIEYDVADVAIRDIAGKYAGMKIVDTDSYNIVVGGIREVRGLRIQVENKRKELKKDALAFGRAVDSEAKRITELLAPIEGELKGVKKVEDDRKAAIKAEKERIERDRIREIRVKISEIQRLADGINGLRREQIEEVLADIDASEIAEDEYQEFIDEAKEVLVAVRAVVQTALETRIKLDREAEERRAEAEGLAKIRAEQEVKAKELAQAEAKRKIEEAALVAERKVIEDEKVRIEMEKRAEAERKERKEREAQIAEAARIQAEKDLKEKARRVAEQKEQEQKDEKIRIETEKRIEDERVTREEALKPDKEKMADYADRLARVELPDLNNPEAKDFIIEMDLKLVGIINELREWAGEEVSDEFGSI